MGLWWNSWRGDRATRIVERVVAAFNARDYAALGDLVAADVSMIDSMGEAVKGRDAAILLLRRLVAHDSAFQIHLENLTGHSGAVLVTGSTTGTRHRSAQRTLWKLLLRDGRVAEWRSYSANDPQPLVKRLMGGRVEFAG